MMHYAWWFGFVGDEETKPATDETIRNKAIGT